MGAISKAGGEIANGKKDTFKDYMQKLAPTFQSVMPKGFTSERLVQMAISARNQTPKLAECDMSSFLSCCLRCASLGLEPSAVDGLGNAYILPYKDKSGKMLAQFQLGKNGMLELVKRSGLVSTIRTQCVYEGDDFDYYEDEGGLHFHYRPNLEAPHGEANLKLVYLSAHMKDGGSVFLAMSKNEVDEIKKRSKAQSFGPWKTDYEAMAEKTVIRRAFNRGLLPRSVEVARVVSQDETTPEIFDEDGQRIFGYEEVADEAEVVEVPENVDPATGEVVDA
jgi:recombination protein RecT